MVNTHLVLCTSGLTRQALAKGISCSLRCQISVRYYSLKKYFEARPGLAKSSVWFELKFLRRIPFHVYRLLICVSCVRKETMVIAVTVSCEKNVVLSRRGTFMWPARDVRQKWMYEIQTSTTESGCDLWKRQASAEHIIHVMCDFLFS